MASEAGDRRWKRYTRAEVLAWVRKDRPSRELDLLAPAALWPRLRAGFGVGAKADVLVYLLGMQGQPSSVSQIATAIHYTKSSVRNAASDMSSARLLRETDGRPAEFTAPLGPWAELLELTSSAPVAGAPTSVPVWTHWASLFSFLAWVTDWADRAKSTTGPQVHLLASEARDIVKRGGRTLQIEGVRTPPIDRFPGKQAASGLLETMRALADWA